MSFYANSGILGKYNKYRRVSDNLVYEILQNFNNHFHKLPYTRLGQEEFQWPLADLITSNRLLLFFTFYQYKQFHADEVAKTTKIKKYKDGVTSLTHHV